MTAPSAARALIAAALVAAACSADPASEPPADAGPERLLFADAAGGADSPTDAGSPPDAEPETEAGSQADAAPAMETETQADSEPATDTQAPPDADSASDSDAEADSEADPGSGSDAAIDAGDVGPAGDGGFGLLSLNLHCLQSAPSAYPDNAARFAAVAQLAAERDVAVLALQEVCDDGTTAALDALEAALEAATGQGWGGAWALAHVGWEGTADEADEGVGILVRGAEVVGEPLVHLVQGGLRRVALTVALPPALGGLRVTAVHLDYADAAVRLMQAREVANAALVDAAPGLGAILAGDFNATMASPAYDAAVAWGFRDLSAALDPGRIDHVMLHRGAPWQAAGATLVFDGGDEPVVSDHPGVLVRLVPGPAEPVTVTRLEAAIDVGFGHWVAYRGDRAPLSWELGWPARVVGADAWVLRVTAWDAGTFSFKALRDDLAWMLGDDASGTAGAAQTVTPAF